MKTFLLWLIAVPFMFAMAVRYEMLLLDYDQNDALAILWDEVFGEKTLLDVLAEIAEGRRDA